ncbi:MAG: hypothetical protein LBD07_06125 [Spirochaetaceae bacterium]|jgi:hypothetical protein|nr:hypothetical protein [Spirochaetaceae bacterium]
MEETRIVDEKNITERDLHFYYNREERLNKASERVRALYEDMPKRKFSLFSSLTDSKPKAAMFISIIVMCLMMLFITKFLPDTGSDLSGNAVSIHVMRYNGSSFVVLKKTAAAKDPWTGIVDVITSNPDSDDAGILSRQIVFTSLETEEFRWSIPLEAKELRFFLQAGAGTAAIRVKSE